MFDRRRFSKLAGATGASAWIVKPRLFAGEPSGLKIDRIELFPLRYPMSGYFKFFVDRRGVTGRDAVLIKITADNGMVGWGQSIPIARWSYETLETATAALREYYVPALLGHDPTDIVGALRVLDTVIAPGFSTGMPITRAGLDLALHDLAGRVQGRNVAEMYGRVPGGPITLSWTVNVTQLSDVESLVDDGWQRGYRNFNIKVAPDLNFDVQLAKRVRKLAPDGFLWADANGGYDAETALQAARQLAAAGVDVLEAPLRPNRIGGYRHLRLHAALPILMDEGVISRVELQEFHELGMMDGLAMKPARCGGLLTAVQQIEYCQAHGLSWLGSGLTDPDISLAASLILYSAFGLTRPAALNGPQFLTNQVLSRPLRIEQDQAYPPTGPGLGIDIDEQEVAELMQQSGGARLLR